MADTASPAVDTSARLELLELEKAHLRTGDELARRRRALPWTMIERPYEFDTELGAQSLRQLFGDASQLLVYHFMFGVDWDEGCPSCSFWADNFDGIDAHLAARDVSFVVASSAPLERLVSYRNRMGWSFRWVSTGGTSFNRDFDVAGSTRYNHRDTDVPIPESPGLSAFALRDGVVHHTYSTYARGLEVFNGAYHLLDLTAKGRDESDLPWTMAWLRRHDQYGD
jgi:predicted dithiol-disulfide oxidoreductase (DUF899 family)